MLVQRDQRLGQLAKPLAGLVLHFGESGGSCQPCEAAYQAISSDPRVCTPEVMVYVSPSHMRTMAKVYGEIFGDTVTVAPLKFTQDELDAQSFLAMMCVSNSAEPPLYVQAILSILREMGDTFSYTAFKTLLAARKESFNSAQKSGLDQRMAILEAFLDCDSSSTQRFRPGRLTIVDLTDPFIDPVTACSVFEIMTRLFVRSTPGTGKVMVIDEAHKYLTMAKSAATLTKTLLSITRQQRHLGIRIIISTQEPTVIPPILLDLCSITIMHRFSSISWFEHLSQHISSGFSEQAFDDVVQLQTGEAIILAPAGVGLFSMNSGPPSRASFGRRYLIIRVRRRVTMDGGRSVLVV
ncbi:hypothetical protein FRC02_007119 [Tulasnella sp. 418]|nr:hypothetical protein FRC02_007119 [Tulasnella sp. 418]